MSKLKKPLTVHYVWEVRTQISSCHMCEFCLEEILENKWLAFVWTWQISDLYAMRGEAGSLSSSSQPRFTGKHEGVNATAQAASPLHTHTHTPQCKAKSKTRGMEENYLLLLTNYRLWLMMPSNVMCQHEAAWSHALLCYVALHHYRALAKCKFANTEVTLVAHHLFHRYLAPPAQNARVANPANLHPGNELTQTAADGIITSFPTFPGMSCLANLAVSFVSWLGQGSSWGLWDDFYAIRGSTKGV